MIYTDTKFNVVAVVGVNRYSSKVTYPTIRKMLEEEVILVDKEKIKVTSIEVTKDDETVYFYGDLVNK